MPVRTPRCRKIYIFEGGAWEVSWTRERNAALRTAGYSIDSVKHSLSYESVYLLKTSLLYGVRTGPIAPALQTLSSNQTLLAICTV